MKVIFNKNSCHLRRDVISRHVAQHRRATTKVQKYMANHTGISLDKFHNKFNELEKRHKNLIAKITLHEATKTSY